MRPHGRILFTVFIGFTLVQAGLPRLGVAQVPARERVGFEAIRETDLRANLGFLSSDGMGGRLSLQPGDDAAIAWVASEFAKAGLTPAVTDEAGKPSFLQAVPLALSPDPVVAAVLKPIASTSRTL